MQRLRVPIIAAAIALLWCVAQAFACGLMAAGVAVLALWAAALTAADRRSDPRPLRTALAVMMLVIAAGLGALLAAGDTGDTGLLGQLVLVVALAPAVPLIYAMTFPTDGDS